MKESAVWAAVWVIDDDRSVRRVLERALQEEQIRVLSFADASSALERLHRERPSLVICDVRMPDMDGLAMLEELKRRAPDIPVILITAYSDLERTVSAFRQGALEFLAKPFDLDKMMRLVLRTLRHSHSGARGPASVPSVPAADGLLGDSPAMRRVFHAIGRLAGSDLGILITGESGTGKELVARALHRHSRGAAGSFVAINTAAIPRELLEAELFGHEKGAFTGALQLRRGRFEQADGGTLFLDEIGDMPPELQAPLLRVLADGEFYRIGGMATVHTDVRLIAATHRDLEERVRAGKFREDLLHRLNVARIHIPPLRERPEDIAGLASRFLRDAASKQGVEPRVLEADTLEHLQRLEWPGNVRQVENFCRWATVMVPTREVHVDDLPPELRPVAPPPDEGEDWERGLRAWAEQSLAAGGARLLAQALPRVERVLFEAALRRSGGNRLQAARLLGCGRNTLSRKLKELRLKL